MKRGLKIQINFTNRAIYTFIAFAIFLVIGVTVFAFGTSSPSTFGHSASELDLSGGIDGDVVFRGNVNVAGNLDVTQGLNVAGNVKGTGLCIGNDCRISWPPASGGGNGGGFPSGVITGSSNSVTVGTSQTSASKSVNLNSYTEAKYIKFNGSCPHILKKKPRSTIYTLKKVSVSLEFFDTAGTSITSGNLCGSYFVPIPLQSSSFRVVIHKPLSMGIKTASWELWTAG